MKDHLKIMSKSVVTFISTKDTKIYPKSSPKGLQNLPKWGESKWENRLPTAAKAAKSFQDKL